MYSVTNSLVQKQLKGCWEESCCAKTVSPAGFLSAENQSHLDPPVSLPGCSKAALHVGAAFLQFAPLQRNRLIYKSVVSWEGNLL